MLDVSNIAKVYLICGCTDLRLGVEQLTSIIRNKYGIRPEGSAIFFFHGRRADRYKAIYWDDDGFLLLRKVLAKGHFSWPKAKDTILELTKEEYHIMLASVSPDPNNLCGPIGMT